MENALELIVVFDKSGRICHGNRAAKDELAYGDAIDGVHISEIFPGAFTDEEGIHTTANLCGQLLNLMAYRKNRTCFRADVRILPDTENPDYYICYVRDVNNQEFLEKELAEVEKKAAAANTIKSEFVANITHELRTPVNGILGNVLELISGEKEEAKLRKLRMIERSCKDMNGIINNILDFSKLEAGKFTLEPRQFEFRSMIDYVRANHISKITEKGLDFFVTVSPEIPECVVGDELRIVQILNNLLSNACKFTSLGKISLEAVKTAQVGKRAELFFMVSDTGIGIDQGDRDKLFKSFSQVDASISRRFGGTGLGLNICKQLVELMGGSISVESELHKGTIFSFSIWVELPGEEDEAPALEQQISPFLLKARSIAESWKIQQDEEEDHSGEFGTEKNRQEIEKRMSMLILSVEMENWEKAEMFVEIIKQLTENAPKEIKTGVLKLKMAVQKENYEKITAAHEALGKMLET
ncbi:MAG: hypothetical protein IJ327_07045 [Lachnospiraceae bacterium]|nr:hypothetical protein [Lachnospiraceae bacterium]